MVTQVLHGLGLNAWCITTHPHHQGIESAVLNSGNVS